MRTTCAGIILRMDTVVGLTMDTRPADSDSEPKFHPTNQEAVTTDQVLSPDSSAPTAVSDSKPRNKTPFLANPELGFGTSKNNTGLANSDSAAESEQQISEGSEKDAGQTALVGLGGVDNGNGSPEGARVDKVVGSTMKKSPIPDMPTWGKPRQSFFVKNTFIGGVEGDEPQTMRRTQSVPLLARPSLFGEDETQSSAAVGSNSPQIKASEVEDPTLVTVTGDVTGSASVVDPLPQRPSVAQIPPAVPASFSHKTTEIIVPEEKTARLEMACIAWQKFKWASESGPIVAGISPEISVINRHPGGTWTHKCRQNDNAEFPGLNRDNWPWASTDLVERWNPIIFDYSKTLQQLWYQYSTAENPAQSRPQVVDGGLRVDMGYGPATFSGDRLLGKKIYVVEKSSKKKAAAMQALQFFGVPQDQVMKVEPPNGPEPYVAKPPVPRDANGNSFVWQVLNYKDELIDMTSETESVEPWVAKFGVAARLPRASWPQEWTRTNLTCNHTRFDFPETLLILWQRYTTSDDFKTQRGRPHYTKLEPGHFSVTVDMGEGPQPFSGTSSKDEDNGDPITLQAYAACEALMFFGVKEEQVVKKLWGASSVSPSLPVPNDRPILQSFPDGNRPSISQDSKVRSPGVLSSQPTESALQNWSPEKDYCKTLDILWQNKYVGEPVYNKIKPGQFRVTVGEALADGRFRPNVDEETQKQSAAFTWLQQFGVAFFFNLEKKGVLPRREQIPRKSAPSVSSSRRRRTHHNLNHNLAAGPRK